MSAQRLVGLVIVLLGYLSGAILIVHPFMPQIEVAAITLIVLFVVCMLLGLPLFTAGEQRAPALRTCGWGLLAIGIAALLGVFVDAVGLAHASSVLLLWIMAPTGLLLGLLLNAFANALERLPDAG